MPRVIAEFNGSRYPTPEVAPLQRTVEHDTSIQAWHNGPFKLVTHIPPFAVERKQKLALGVCLSALSTIASLSFNCPVGSCLVFASMALLIGDSDPWIVGESTAERDRDEDCMREREVMIDRLGFVEEPVAIEVLPGWHNEASSKTYDFSQGHFAKAWAMEHRDRYSTNFWKIMVKDSNDQILEMAGSPGTNGWRCS